MPCILLASDTHASVASSAQPSVNTHGRFVYPVKTPQTAKAQFMTNRNPSLRDQHELSECLVQDWVTQTIPKYVLFFVPPCLMRL